ncbi:hypothetical protein BASA60_004048 [Batrachochytrium salamandrivorans]|nr:hypothetical protein BASA60_004048 [Batrachochytrium salamandrivorans]
MFAVPGNAPPDEAVCIAARAAVGVAGAGGVAHCINPNTPKRLSCGKYISSPLSTRQSVMDIPAQAPDQPAIVNPVAAVNPIATNGNDNMPQPVGAVHPHQYPQALPAAMYPDGISWRTRNGSRTDIPTPLGPAPSSMLMPQNFLTDVELCAIEGTLRNAIIPAIGTIGRIQTQLAGITAQFNQILHMLPTETHVDESHKHK